MHAIAGLMANDYTTFNYPDLASFVAGPKPISHLTSRGSTLAMARWYLNVANVAVPAT